MPKYIVRSIEKRVWDTYVSAEFAEDLYDLDLRISEEPDDINWETEIYDEDGNDVDWEAEEARVAKQQEETS